MTFITSTPTTATTSNDNQPKGRLVKALDRFVRFSQFYGEHESRSPSDRYSWVKEQQS